MRITSATGVTLAGRGQGVPRLPADQLGRARRDAGPLSPSGPREYLRQVDGHRRSRLSVDGPGRSVGRMPTTMPVPRHRTIDRDPFHRRCRRHASGQSAGATEDQSRARTRRQASVPRTSRPRPAGLALQAPSRTAATATGARGRAVSAGADETPSAAKNRDIARVGEGSRYCPRAQTRRLETPRCSSGDGERERWDPYLTHGSPMSRASR